MAEKSRRYGKRFSSPYVTYTKEGKRKGKWLNGHRHNPAAQ